MGMQKEKEGVFRLSVILMGIFESLVLINAVQ
jgi:hypothetical protein